MISRTIAGWIERDLEQKMVFVSGPRQCGKTTLAKSILTKCSGAYYNWDSASHRRLIQNNQLDESAKLWVLDELHKFRSWRNWLKGQYDLRHPDHAFLVTGSARLDVYRRGGDSLQGRYFPYRLHPLTFSEFVQSFSFKDMETFFALPNQSPPGAQEALQELLMFGGFPEPLLSSSQRFADRWRLGYGERIVQEEIRDLERILDLGKVELLFDRLPDIVGSVLSINNLRQDLEKAFETVKHWLQVFDQIYATFRISPFGPPRIKAVKKEQKLYLFDWSRVSNEGARFENLVAVHLLRLVHWLQDVLGQKHELKFFRDVQHHEVDFILMKQNKPLCVVEVKKNAKQICPNLKFFLERVRVPYAFQVHLEGTDHWQPNPINGCDIQVVPAIRFLANLP